MDRRRSSISPTERRVRGRPCLAPAATLAGAAFAFASGACNPAVTPSAAAGVTEASLTVTSRSFSPNRAIPVDFTCDGVDKSPEITWSAPPAGTKTFAILCDDSDGPGGSFTHWIVFNLGADIRSLREGADPATVGGAVGTNDFERSGYNGPCPPKGEAHRYAFRVYALDAALDVPPGPGRSATASAMSGHVLAEGALTGIYAR